MVPLLNTKVTQRLTFVPNVDPRDVGLVVSDLITLDRSWDLSRLVTVLPGAVRDAILDTPVSYRPDVPDSVLW